MMRAVIDTNVIISALLKPGSKPGRIIEMVLEGKINAVVSRDMLGEYKRVVYRRKFSFTQEQIDTVLVLFDKAVLELPLPGQDTVNADDAVFLAAAIAGGADYLITGNIRHFPERKYGNCLAVTPAEFLLKENY